MTEQNNNPETNIPSEPTNTIPVPTFKEVEIEGLKVIAAVPEGDKSRLTFWFPSLSPKKVKEVKDRKSGEIKVPAHLEWETITRLFTKAIDIIVQFGVNDPVTGDQMAQATLKKENAVIAAYCAEKGCSFQLCKFIVETVAEFDAQSGTTGDPNNYASKAVACMMNNSDSLPETEEEMESLFMAKVDSLNWATMLKLLKELAENGRNSDGTLKLREAGKKDE